MFDFYSLSIIGDLLPATVGAKITHYMENTNI